jgi:HTH-type transcriptional regulator/antitoxin HigA
MASVTKKRIESNLAIHPGEMLAEEIEARGMTQKALAEAMGRPPQLVNEIVRGKKAITAETALQLEQVLDIPAYLWLAKQSRYDLIMARQAQKARKSA